MAHVALAIDGGWTTDSGPSAPYLVKSQDAFGIPTLSVPWLMEAQNVVFATDGWPQKMPGASNVNGTATGATDHVNGVFDYWKSNTSGAQTQQRIVYAGTQIYSESSGTLTSRKTGLEAARMPWFEVMNDDLVIATSSAVDVPMAWDQTTFANLGGSPPNFAFHVVHKGRMWAAGVFSNKSRVYYSVLDAHEDWTGAGSGSIDVAPDDGDVITGLRRHRDELVVFKGPNRGSLHRVSGSAPTGTDAFALHPHINGVGATNNQAIINRGGDLWFWDDNGIHSMEVTNAFGDYQPRFLSAPISSYFIKQLNHSRFDFVWGANFTATGYALWTCSRAGVTTHDLVIGLDYRFPTPRFFQWPAMAVASLAMVRDTSRETILWAGTYAGRVMRLNQAARNIAGTAYNALTRLPYLSFGDPFHDKQALHGRVGFAPKGETSFTVGWQRDGNTQQTATVTQEGTASLGTSDDQFILDTDVLGGGRYKNKFPEVIGMFKELQIELSQGTLDVDFEPHGFGLELEDAGIAHVEPVG
mgnify:FL=1